MMRSLLSAVAGMRNHQVRMDVIGNNVANVNTVAFKGGRATFKESFSQLLTSAVQPTDTQGGINPAQIGTGMQLGSIDTIFTQGNFEATGVKSDLMVQGNSFFVVAQGNSSLYTRAGNFQLDAQGNLVHPTNGFKLQGRVANASGVLQNGVTDLRVPFGMKTAANPTSQASIIGNLNSEATPGTQAQTTITTYDMVGAKHELQITFTKAPLPAENTWTYSVASPTAAVTSGATGTAVFNNDGTLDVAGSTFPDITLTPGGSSGPFTIDLNVGDGSVNWLTQMKGTSTPILRDQDGYPMGDLLDFSIDQLGVITGSFSNGRTITLAQIALADFNNPAGLTRQGDNMFTVSSNSGDPVVGFSGAGSQSSIASGGLEMSNVDLTQEFTRMIVSQRGFQASGRVITSSDEMLQEVVNLKR